MRKLVLSTLLTLTVAASAAIAKDNPVQLIEASGKVLVNTGKGFVPAGGDVALTENVSVFVGKGAVARVSFPAINCNVTLPENKVSVLNAKRLCEGETKAVQIEPAAYEGVPGEIPPAIIVGGVVAASAAALIYSFTHDDGPVSP